MMQLYDRIINPNLLIRRINICACNLIYENNIPKDDSPVQLQLFVDYEEEGSARNRQLFFDHESNLARQS